MTVIETKYSIGDVVYYAMTRQENKQHPCPDCKGERIWKAISPAGSEYQFACPRCASSYRSDRDLSLQYAEYVPTFQRLTIGSVKHDTHDIRYAGNGWVQSPKTEYMCNETGVGAGSIYAEDRLYLTKEEAMSAANVMASEVNTKTDWIVTLYNKSLSISDYQLENALMANAKAARSRANSMLSNLGYLFEKIREAADKDEILEKIDWYREYDWQSDKDRIADGVSARAEELA